MKILGTFKETVKKKKKSKEEKQLETFLGCGKIRESSIKSASCEESTKLHFNLFFLNGWSLLG